MMVSLLFEPYSVVVAGTTVDCCSGRTLVSAVIASI